MWGFIMRRRAFLIACFRLALLGWSLYTCYVVLPVRDVHASLPQEGSRDREDLLKVVEFTGTPSLAEYKGFLNSSRRMTSLTACVRFRVRTFTGRDPLLSLQDIATNRKIQLWLELWLDRVRLVLADTWRFQLLPRHLRPNVWYHLCTSYSRHQNASRYRTYVDGVLVNTLDSDVIKPVYGDNFVVGQSLEDGHSMNASITQANVWDYALPPQEIELLANCSSDTQGSYVSWDQDFTLTSATYTHVALNTLCEQAVNVTYMWFPSMSDKESFYICEALGTHLPIPETSEDCLHLQQLSQATWSSTGSCAFGFITAIVDSVPDGSFYRHYDKVPFPNDSAIWAEDEPNGGIYEGCVLMNDVGIYDGDCKRDHCAVCRFSEPQVFILRGTCELELRNTFFLAFQGPVIGSLQFQGYGDYIISLDGGRWVWRDSHNDFIIASMDLMEPYYPMGRRLWTLTGSRLVCGQRSGARMISLSPCQDGYFTCDNAVCIPLQERCDLKYDCQDHSDETQCDLVFFPQEYRSDLPPTGSEGSPLSISLLLSLHSMGVETSRTQFYATHELAMQWHDHRLVFRNMKDEATLNVIPQTDMHRIWTPMVGFVNTENNDHSRVDEEATLVALKTTPMAGWNESSSTEEPLYPGSGNRLKLHRKYTTLFVCDFDLNLYPFDVQRCPVHLKLIAAPSNYLQFKEDEMRAEYLGPELLIEYQVGSLKMVFSNATEGEVRFEVTLGRRSGYAILTIYIPSLILLIISYVTLFFRAKIFEVRVMAALTSLLVVATLFTQASSSLPKTSYFKMVDIWLLFCIGVIFLIIICHALIDAILSQSQVEDFDTADITRNFLKKNVHNDLAPIVSMWKKHRKSGRKKKADPRRRGQVSTTRVMVRPYEGQGGWVAAGGGVTAGGNRNVDAFIYGDQKCWQETDSVAISQCFRRQQSFNEKVNEESEYDNDTLKEDEGREDDTLKREASKIVSSDQVDRPYSSAEKLIKASKILILILVALFNIIYWSYINS